MWWNFSARLIVPVDKIKRGQSLFVCLSACYFLMLPLGYPASGSSTKVNHGRLLSFPKCYIYFSGVGNITSAGEFNFYSDPEAAHIVLTSACCPIYLLPWETCLCVDISMVSASFLYVQ
jgi:hypothetical protein